MSCPCRDGLKQRASTGKRSTRWSKLASASAPSRGVSKWISDIELHCIWDVADLLKDAKAPSQHDSSETGSAHEAVGLAEEMLTSAYPLTN